MCYSHALNSSVCRSQVILCIKSDQELQIQLCSWLSTTSQFVFTSKEGGRRGNAAFRTHRQKYLADHTENIHAVCRPLNCSTCKQLVDAAEARCSMQESYTNTRTAVKPCCSAACTGTPQSSSPDKCCGLRLTGSAVWGGFEQKSLRKHPYA